MVDALDDEEALAGADIAECARLARERVDRGRGAEAMLEPRLVGAELLHHLLVPRELAAGIDVRLQRAVVQKRDEHERADRKPAAEHDRARGTATLRRHRSEVRGVRARPFSTRAPTTAVVFGRLQPGCTATWLLVPESPGCGEPRPSAGRRLEEDDRDRAARLLLVAVVAGIQIRERAPASLALVPLSRAGLHVLLA